MRLATSRTSLAAAAALAAVASLPASAQWAELTGLEFISLADRPAGSAPVTVNEGLTSRACPGTPFPLTMTYPQGLDAGGPADRAVAALAGRFLAEGKAVAEEYLAEIDGEGCPGSFEYAAYKVEGTPFAVSRKAFSVLFGMYSNTGGAHPSYWYVSQNLLPDGTELGVGRLFPDPARSLPLLWERIYWDSCSRGEPTAPAYYDAPGCGRAVPPLPSKLRPGAVSLDGLGHAVLTSMGLAVSLNPYEAWYWARGPLFIDVPKDELLRIGADPELWR
jgi:hypothetical protein